ncbi:MAG: hypothetical protein MZV49_26155 [Rhodopseudomonas palustris]|nr:hypothetical protein [Rhodopseudomonas palustris]
MLQRHAAAGGWLRRLAPVRAGPAPVWVTVVKRRASMVLHGGLPAPWLAARCRSDEPSGSAGQIEPARAQRLQRISSGRRSDVAEPAWRWATHTAAPDPRFTRQRDQRAPRCADATPPPSSLDRGRWRRANLAA